MTADIRQFFGRELYVRSTDVFLDTLYALRTGNGYFKPLVIN